MYNNPLRIWFHGLAAAAVSNMAAAAGGVLGASLSGMSIFSGQFWSVVGGAALGGALVSVIGYLKQSPLPPLSGER